MRVKRVLSGEKQVKYIVLSLYKSILTILSLRATIGTSVCIIIVFKV